MIPGDENDTRASGLYYSLLVLNKASSFRRGVVMLTHVLIFETISH